MKKNKGVYWFAIGLLLVAINIVMDTGVGYTGYAISQGMSLKDFAYVESFQAISSANFTIDIFFDPLGYLMMIIGLTKINRESRYARNAVVFCLVGMITSSCQMFLPFIMSPDQAVKMIIILLLLEIFSRAVILYSVAVLCAKQVDSYKHMEVGKDLKFAAELYTICMVISIILSFFARAQLFLANAALLFTSGCTLFAAIYYVFKVIKFNNKLSLFNDVTKEI